MLTSLLHFQAQGWEKWLSRLKFAVGTLLSTIIPLASIIGSAIELDLPLLQLLAQDMPSNGGSIDI
jgi:hypothetical protein